MQSTITVKTKNKYEMIDITKEIENIVKKNNIKEGVCNCYLQHTTAALIINENYDPNICKDILNCLGKLIPEGKWLHDKIDNNAAAHIKSAILGCSINIPVKDSKLQLGQWQSPILVEFDGPRERKIIVSVI